MLGILAKEMDTMFINYYKLLSHPNYYYVLEHPFTNDDYILPFILNIF